MCNVRDGVSSNSSGCDELNYLNFKCVNVVTARPEGIWQARLLKRKCKGTTHANNTARTHSANIWKEMSKVLGEICGHKFFF